MASSYPSTFDAFTNPTASDKTNSATVPHATQHANANDAIEAIQRKIGLSTSGPSSSPSSGLVFRSTATNQSGWGSIDNTYLDNRTRSLFLPASAFFAIAGAPTSTSVIWSPAWAMDPSSAEGVSAAFTVPHDYSTGSIAATVYWTNASTSAGSVSWRVGSFFTDSGVTLNGTYTPGSTGLAVVASTVGFVTQASQISTALGGGTPAAGRYSQIRVDRTSSSTGDTLAVDAHFLGVRLDYTADM
jgi:hypothetical protein